MAQRGKSRAHAIKKVTHPPTYFFLFKKKMPVFKNKKIRTNIISRNFYNNLIIQICKNSYRLTAATVKYTNKYIIVDSEKCWNFIYEL